MNMLMTKAEFKTYLGDRAFYRNVVAIAVPISLQSLITIGVNMMDTIMLGKLGEVAISASSLANQFITLFQICCMGMGMGASVLTSRFWGMQNIPSLKKSVTIMYRLCFFIGLGFTLATIFAPGALMQIYTSDPDVIREGIGYFRWSIPCYWLLGFALTTTIVLRSIGQVRIPLLCSLIAFFINIGATWVFIFGKLGAPAMGVQGAALGTLISRIFEFSFICGYFLFVEKKVGYRIQNVLMKCGDLVGEYMRISIPVLISDTLLGLGNNAGAMVIGRLGANFVSANAITTVTMQLSTVFIQGMSNASAIITGHTLGQGQVERAQKQGYTFLGLGAAIGLVGGVLIAAISDLVISFYDITPETKGIAEQLMLAIGFIVFFQAINSILTKGVLRGGGDTKFLMIADILFLWAASVPLGALAGFWWHLSPFLIYTCLKIDQIIKAVWCVFRLRSRKWIKKI